MSIAANHEIERMYMRENRRSTYIALLDMNLIWSRSDVYQLDIMWNAGKSLAEMGEYFKRDLDEIAILIMDRIRKGKIKSRPGGVFGNG